MPENVSTLENKCFQNKAIPTKKTGLSSNFLPNLQKKNVRPLER